MGVSFWGPYSKDPTLLLFRVLYESPLFPLPPLLCIYGFRGSSSSAAKVVHLEDGRFDTP